MKVLAIGNSFSQDATRYLHQIAKSDGCDITVVNLYIGGCSLYTHYKNMLEDKKAYSMEFNGEPTGFFVSIKEALLAHDWDYISLQQVSHESISYETFQPYLQELVKYIKIYCPKAKLAIHQTWSYEQGSEQLKNLGYVDRLDMMVDVKNAYKNAAKDAKADAIIVSGELFHRLAGAGMEPLYRDGFHASLGLGRYAIGLLWYATLTGKSILGNKFLDTEIAISPEDADTVRKIVEGLR